MQDNLPDIPPSPAIASAKAGPEQQKSNLFADDKRLVKIILLVGFGLLLILGIAAAILEQVAPRGGKKTAEEELFSANLWQIQVRPNQMILGFFEDSNKNNQFDYREKPFAKVSVAIRRSGETEPFRRVSAGIDGLVKIDDLNLGDYEISLDNYAEGQSGDWLFFEEYQQSGEFLPTAWRRVTLAAQGYQELIGLFPYQPPLLLTLMTDSGISWYDPERARVYGQSNTVLVSPAARGRNIYYLQEGKLKKFDWSYRTVSEEMIWLEEAESGSWWLSDQGKTVAYLSGKEFRFRSQIEDCSEGGFFYEGVRPEVKTAAFIDETSWLVIARIDKDQLWQLFKVNCNEGSILATVGEPINVGSLGGDWFYSTADATYFYDQDKQQAVKYTALGGGLPAQAGEGISVSADKRYLLKKVAADLPAQAGNWLAVDYPEVKTSWVEKHYLLTGITGEPTVIGDAVYFVRAKPCEADGDCGEVVKIKLEGSSVWSIASVWDLKNVAAAKVLGVVE